MFDDLLLISTSRFIERFATHVIVGTKMGGKDVIYIRQQHSSNLQHVEVKKRLKEIADRRFLDASGQYGVTSKEAYGNGKVISHIFSLSCLTILKRDNCFRKRLVQFFLIC